MIQNSDDNNYPEGVLPSLKMEINRGYFQIYNNEVGFSEANITSICAVGESTKAGKVGYIGA